MFRFVVYYLSDLAPLLITVVSRTSVTVIICFFDVFSSHVVTGGIHVDWQTLCSKDCLLRILGLRKRETRVIPNAEAPSSALFHRLHLLLFFVETFHRKWLAVPDYLMETCNLNRSKHTALDFSNMRLFVQASVVK